MGNMKSSKKTWKEWELEEAHTQFETDFLPIDDIYKDFTPHQDIHKLLDDYKLNNNIADGIGRKNTYKRFKLLNEFSSVCFPIFILGIIGTTWVTRRVRLKN